MEMLRRVTLNLPKGHPFKVISLASFDIMTGITICFSWTCESDFIEDSIASLFKTVLGVVHRHNLQYFERFPCSFYEFQEDKISLAATVFKDSNPKSTTFYSLGFFFDSTRLVSHPTLFSTISSLMMPLSKTVQYHIDNDIPYHELAQPVSIAATRFTHLFCDPKRFDDLKQISAVFDVDFLSRCVSSHLQTQMTTIIAADSLEEAKPLYTLLTGFMLPWQQNQSSTAFACVPDPLMYLQIISSPSVLPSDVLLQFSRPWTWINLTKKEVIQSADVSTQADYSKTYQESVLLDFSVGREELDSRRSKIFKSYQSALVNPSRWAVEAASVISKTPHSQLKRVVSQLFDEILNRSIVLISMVKHYVGQSQSLFLQQDQVREIIDMMEIREKDELKMLVSIANIFEPTMYKRIYSGRREVLMHMIATL